MRSRDGAGGSGRPPTASRLDARPGALRMASIAMMAPMEWPSRCTGATWRRARAIVISAQDSNEKRHGRGLRPAPGRSTATTRCEDASAGPSAAKKCVPPPRPWRHRTTGPLPHVTTRTRAPATSTNSAPGSVPSATQTLEHEAVELRVRLPGLAGHEVPVADGLVLRDIAGARGFDLPAA